MYLKLNEGILRKIVSKAIENSGNIRKLQDETGISKSSLSLYKNEKRAIKDEKLKLLLNISGIKIKDENIKYKLENNWKQKKGGINCVESKKKKGTFENQLILARINSAKKLKEWHRKMKTGQPEKYYEIQHARFKKAAGKKFKTILGIFVRNNLEKDIANRLAEMKIDYEYEPMIRIEGKCFFPDFLINKKIIIECTMWKGYDKATKLKNKINLLEKHYKIFVFVPKPLYKYYQQLNNYLISDLDNICPGSSAR